MKKIYFLPVILFFLMYCSEDNSLDLGKENSEKTVHAETKALQMERTAIEKYRPEAEREIITLNNGMIIEKVDTTFVYQGDILLSSEQINFFYDSPQNRGAITSLQRKYWPNNQVYYTFDEGFQYRDLVLEAMDHFHATTNVTFIPATASQPNKIKFIHDGNDSYSYIGMIGGTQVTSIGIYMGTKGTVMHELGHALGLLHEHTKRNRDNYINVNISNIESSSVSNFNIEPSQIYDEPFDFESVMLYDSYAAAIDPNIPVLTRKDGSTWMAQREYLSSADLKMINSYYPYNNGYIRGLKIPTHNNNGAGVEVADMNNNGIQDLIFSCTNIASSSSGKMNRTVCYQIFYDLDFFGNPKSVSDFFWLFDIEQSSTQNFGTSVCALNINNNKFPELIFIYSKGGTNATKHLVYRAVFDIGINGPGTYSKLCDERGIGGFITNACGIGVDIYDFNKNGKPDMIFTIGDDPSGVNTFQYMIGYDLDQNGDIAGGLSSYNVTAGLGHYSQGAGVTVADINKNGTPDIMFMSVDSPSGLNYINYKILWDVSRNGTSSYTDQYFVREPFLNLIGNDHQGGDCVIRDINKDGKLDCIFMALDNPEGANEWRYFTGFNINNNGNFEFWGKPRSIVH